MSDLVEDLRHLWRAAECEVEEVPFHETVRREADTVLDELTAARESALLHAVAVDELRRELARTQREALHLRQANRELQADLDRILRIVR